MKEVSCYTVRENLPKCLVFLLNLYRKKPLKCAFFDNNILYLLPKTYMPEDPDAPWYEEVAVGKNTFLVMVKEMCVEAKIDKKTNHIIL